jgi:RNA polymerase sigma-70 factor (ECF subfamily)
MSRQAADSKEFEQQALTHLPSLLAVATRLTRNAVEAEDVVQDTLVKALRARHQYESGTNLKAWLLRILKNTFINRYRRGGLERSVLEGPDADPLADGWIGTSSMRALRDPEAQALRPVLEAEIKAALDTVPEDFRTVVLLADVEELSYKEIAEVIGCPVGTVMSRLHRGRRLLKQSLIEHARQLGIVEAPSTTDESTSEPADLTAYRERRRAKS